LRLNCKIKTQERVCGCEYLVDGTWDHTGNVLAAPKDLREGATEGGSGLNRWETDLANAVCATETKDALCLVECDTLLDT